MSKTTDQQPTTAPTREKYTKDLLLLFAIPGTIALIAALAVYIPQLLAKPKTDFIYSFCDEYECNDAYSVDSGGYVKHQQFEDSDVYYHPTRKAMSLRYYEAATDTYRTITLAEAQSHTLDTSAKSPDGYTLSSADNNGGFLFWDNYEESWYLKNGAKRKKVELVNSDSYYSDNVTFLGWVKK
jgi:hypothetical protein